MKKVFIIVGIILLSIMMSSCNKLKEETRVLGGCVYTDREDLRECTTESLPAHNYVGFIFDKKEFNIDNVEVTVYFGIDEKDFREDYYLYYDQIEYPYDEPNEIIDYNIYVCFNEYKGVSLPGSIEENEVLEVKNGRFLIDKIKFTALETFPFEEYAFDKVEIEDERYKEKYIYNKSYKITIPKEMFSMKEGEIHIFVDERVHFEEGSEKRLFAEYCARSMKFNYKKEGDKIIIWN